MNNVNGMARQDEGLRVLRQRHQLERARQARHAVHSLPGLGFRVCDSG